MCLKGKDDLIVKRCKVHIHDVFVTESAAVHVKRTKSSEI